MRSLAVLLLAATPSAAAGPTAGEMSGTLKFVAALYDPSTGGYKATADAKPGLSATSSAVRVTKLFGGGLPDKAKTTAFVLSCYDASTGWFYDGPGPWPDAVPAFALTPVGLMAAAELGVPADKFAKAVDAMRARGKTFDEVRIGAAGLEALNARPAWLGEWFEIADAQLKVDGTAGTGDGVARDTASVVAMKLRLGVPRRQLAGASKLVDVLQAGQRADGGYGKGGAAGSDLESTYRVMRALMLMRERPKHRDGMRKFVAHCRHPDGGYGVTPGDPSTMSGVYYAAMIGSWLVTMEK